LNRNTKEKAGSDTFLASLSPAISRLPTSIKLSEEYVCPYVYFDNADFNKNGFNASMAVTDVSKLASCTSCTFDQDLSNYWTANVYFKARNGTYKRVPQMVNDAIGAANAGITVYYTAPGPNTVTAFKPVSFM
jgi:hypothetical protein